MRRACYTSRSLIRGDLGAYSSIKRVSQANNARAGLTGALYYDDTTFFQVVEGEPDAVGSLLDRLKIDSRHKDMFLLEDWDCGDRIFPDWSMKCVMAFEEIRGGPHFSYDDILHGGSDARQTVRDLLLCA